MVLVGYGNNNDRLSVGEGLSDWFDILIASNSIRGYYLSSPNF